MAEEILPFPRLSGTFFCFPRVGLKTRKALHFIAKLHQRIPSSSSIYQLHRFAMIVNKLLVSEKQLTRQVQPRTGTLPRHVPLYRIILCWADADVSASIFLRSFPSRVPEQKLTRALPRSKGPPLINPVAYRAGLRPATTLCSH